jgi:hypothetical protein
VVIESDSVRQDRRRKTRESQVTRRLLTSLADRLPLAVTVALWVILDGQ